MNAGTAVMSPTSVLVPPNAMANTGMNGVTIPTATLESIASILLIRKFHLIVWRRSDALLVTLSVN
jgi:hypothetical protein